MAVAIVLFGTLLQMGVAHSETDPSALEISTDQEVIYGTIGPLPVADTVRQALAEGTTISFIWKITFKEVRDYWFNDKIGTITLVRQAEPDLISQSWLLTDASSGISYRVYSLDKVILFLSRLDQFPLLDRSLLASGTVYRFQIKLHIAEGELGDSWWAEMLRFSDSVAEEDIILP